MLRTYYGGGRTKYGQAVLELWLTLEHEYSEALKKLHLSNWLVNPSGLAGAWHALDLLMEHTVKELKALAQRHATDFDDSFFRNVISPSIAALAGLKHVFDELHGLSARSTRHGEDAAKRAVMLGRLADHSSKHETLVFRKGRSFGQRAVNDDYALGHDYIGHQGAFDRHLQRTVDIMRGIPVSDTDTDSPDADVESVLEARLRDEAAVIAEEEGRSASADGPEITAA